MVRDTTSIIYKQPQNEPCKVQSVCRSSRLFIWGEMDFNKRWGVDITSFTLLINFTSTGSNLEKTVKILVVLKKVQQIQDGTILLLLQLRTGSEEKRKVRNSHSSPLWKCLSHHSWLLCIISRGTNSRGQRTEWIQMVAAEMRHTWQMQNSHTCTVSLSTIFHFIYFILNRGINHRHHPPTYIAIHACWRWFNDV